MVCNQCYLWMSGLITCYFPSHCGIMQKYFLKILKDLRFSGKFTNIIHSFLFNPVSGFLTEIIWVADNHIQDDRGNCLYFEVQNKFSLALKLDDSYHHIVLYELVVIWNLYFSRTMVLIKAYF